MRIAIISDVHANLEALEQVLRDSEKQGVEIIHFIGDAVGYGCNPDECVKLLVKHCDIKLLGNHDYVALGLESTEAFNKAAQEALSWTQNTISEKTLEILADFELEADYLDYHLVHATPDHPDRWQYLFDTIEAREQFRHFTQSICLIGHSHFPSIFVQNGDGAVTMHMKSAMQCQPDRRYIVNVGSVGQPRDKDNRACYVIIDTDANKILFRRVAYDIDATQAKMRKARLPEFLIERLAAGV
ncbi:MAG: metallophosphoesterase family protein [candidate division Zixibacteria bacterium]|nr:metallophosphoesterase family protein [candidate division Zixibacteria bacterium]